MSNAQGKPLVVACAMALAIAVPSLRADVRSAPGPQDHWNRFTADVTIRRSVVQAGTEVTASRTPPTMYRWERVLSGAGWKTTMEVKGSGRAAFVTPTGALQEVAPVVARIEDDGGDEGPRFYGADGKRLRLPSSADRGKMIQALRDVATAPGEVVGPGDWAKAKELIKAGKDINYEGAGGSYEFDANGDVTGYIGKFIVDGSTYKQIAIFQ